MVRWRESHSVVSDSLRPHGLYRPWDSPSQNTRVGSRSLLQGIFPTQGLNPGLLHCRRILYQLSHKGSPRILEWVAYPFSSRSPQLRNRTGIYQLNYEGGMWLDARHYFQGLSFGFRFVFAFTYYFFFFFTIWHRDFYFNFLKSYLF